MEQTKGFFWEQHAGAEKACLDILDDCKRNNSSLAHFEQKLIQKTSSRLLDWVDHFLLRDSKQVRDKLARMGFAQQPDIGHEAWYHQGALLPRIVLLEKTGPDSG